MKSIVIVMVGLSIGLVCSQKALAVSLEGSSTGGGSGTIVSTYVAGMPTTGVSTGLTYGGTVTSNLGSFNIVINAGSTLAANTAALAAFERAAAQWESRISDPITVNIAADLAPLGDSRIIGQSSSEMFNDYYSEIRDAMVADAANESDDQIVSKLPNASQFTASLPTNFKLSGYLSATKANLKALGFTGLDETHGATDATIKLNTGFSFDYDRSDGVTAGTMDMETVVAHEIGHALGFVSEVDLIDEHLNTSETLYVTPTALDLFRFDNNGSADPTTTAEFTTFSRSLVPNNDEITDQISAWGNLTQTEFRMATGFFNGDGNQASHWKDDLGIGLMDPTLNWREVVSISEADFRAFDLIGYDISPVPEPGALAMLAGVAAFWFVWRRRR